MAEIVGTVASVFTFATTIHSTFLIAVQTYHFIKDFIGLSTRISDNLDRAQSLNALIHPVEWKIDCTKRRSLSQPDPLLSYVRECREVVETASTFLNDVRKQISDVEIWTRTKAPFKILLREDLYRIETQLILHVQVWTLFHAVQQMRSNDNVENIDQNSSSLTTIEQVNKNSSQQLFAARTAPYVLDKPETECIPIRLNSDALGLNQRRSTSLLVVSSPAWLASAGTKFEFQKATSGKISLGLRPYYTQPDDSEIFVAVSIGDLGKTVSLFRSGVASPFVRDSSGCSLLHYASSSNNVVLCKMMLKYLDDCVDEETPHGFTVGQLSLLNTVWNRQDKASINILMSMFKEYSSNPEYGESLRVFLIGCCTGTTDVDTLRRFQKIAAPRLFQEPSVNLLRTAGIYILASQSSRHPNADVFLFLLGQKRAGKLDGAVVSRKARGHLLHLIAIGMIRYHRDSRPTSAGRLTPDEFTKGARQWTNLACSFVRNSKGDELYDICKLDLDNSMKGYSRTRPIEWTGSLLISALHALFLDDFPGRLSTPDVDHRENQSWEQITSSTIKLWLEQLANGGVNLMGYGQREEELLATRRSEDASCLDFTARWSFWSPQKRRFIESTLPVYLAGFAHGPLVEDWALHWEVDFEKLAGEFWQNVEDIAYPHIPGAWVE